MPKTNIKSPKIPDTTKVFIFKLIAIFIPLIFICLLEISLRIFHYGHDLHLFVNSNTQKDSLVFNKYVSQKYFTQSENATIGTYEPFAKVKTPNTFRIFVLGESTSQGFPYNHNGSFHRWLKYRLMHTFPEKNIEIINLSLTAVNSITVYDFSKEVVNYTPDAVLVYVGHNEYYGALGIGSTSNIGNNLAVIRLKLKLKPLRIVQLMINTIHSIASIFQSNKQDNNQQLMKRMALNQHIIYNSSSYFKGMAQFEQNLNDICKVFSKHKIPLFISNLVNNEKDLKPFISDTSSTEKSAIAQFQLAQQAYNNHDFSTAKNKFILSKDLDLLRFRAPEALNTSISKITKLYSGVYLVDTHSLFESKSPNQIIGHETILEHVHPNLFGYALISDAFYNSLLQHKLLLPEKDDEISFEQLLDKMPVTTIDSLIGVYAIARMMQDWPFNNPKSIIKIDTTYEADIANNIVLGNLYWNRTLDDTWSHYVKLKDWNNALKIAEAAILEYPQKISAYNTAAKICLKINDPKRMLFYMQKAFEIEKSIDKAKNIVAVCIKYDYPEKSLPYIDFMIESNASKSNFTKAKEIITRLIQIKSGLTTDPSNIALLNSAAAAYCILQNKTVALKYLNMALVNKPDNKQSLEIKQKLDSFQDSELQIH